MYSLKPTSLQPLLRGVLALVVLTLGIPAQAAPSALPFILHSFDGSTNGGSNPGAGPLVYVPLFGKIFGTTTGFSSPNAQTTGNLGTVFSVEPVPNGAFTPLLTIVGGVLNNGLALGFDSNSQPELYGTNLFGDFASTTQYGEIFGVNPANNTSTPTYSFDDLVNRTGNYPVNPQAGVAAAPDGYLYGTTRYSYKGDGSYPTTTYGVLYRVLPNLPESTFEILHRFASDGSEGHPMKGALPLVTSSGVIYGISTTSGIFYDGTPSPSDPAGTGFIYKYDPSVSDPAQRFQIVKRLDPSIVGNFTYSQASLMQGSDGMLYGTSDSGGAKNGGTVFRINPTDNSVALQYTFDNSQAVGGDPAAGLTVGADHNLYGITRLAVDPGTGGGVAGSVFRLRADGSGNYSQADVLHQFAGDGSEGFNCADPMIEVGHILFGVSNKGGQFNDGLIFQVDETSVAVPLPAPTITKLTYIAHADGTSEVDVDGTNFVSLPTADITNTNEAGLTVTFGSATQLTLNLPTTLSAGDHLVTITNPDGQSAKATLTTLGAPFILTPPTAITDTNGATHLVVSGYNFAPPGYNGSASGSVVVVQAVDAQGNASNVDATVALGPDAPPNTTGPQQFIVTLNSTAAGSFSAYDHFNVEVFNPDGQHSVLPSPAARGAHSAVGARPQASPLLPPASFRVFDQDHTKYHLYFDNGSSCSLLDVNVVDAQLALANSQSSPTQLLLGDLSLLHENSVSQVSVQGTGTATTGLISDHGAGLISQDGSSLITQDGSTLVGNDGSSLDGKDDSSLITQDGSNIIGENSSGFIGQNGSSFIGQNGSSFIGQNGSSLTSVPVAAAAVLADIQAGAGLKGSLLISDHGAGIVSTNGSNLVPTFSPLIGVRGSANSLATPQAQSATAVSFFLGRNDEGPTHGTAPTDATFIGSFADGTTELLLDIRYTPGQPDIVEYMAPGVTLTPADATPTPQVVSPAPTLASVSPNAVPAGSGDTTIAVTGTLFTSGSVVNFNGQALTTTVISGTQLTATVPAGLLTTPGAASITVINPAPGGGASNAAPFTVNVGIPPTTTATVIGTRNTAGAYTTAAIVTLTAAPGSFPIAATTYSVDNGPQQTYTAPFTVSTTGAHVVTYSSTDTAGNTEATQTLRLTLQPIAHVFPAGLQLLSVPADYSGVALSAALSVPNPKLAVWSPTLLNYVLTPTAPADALRPGLGYWARFSAAANLYDLGTPTPTAAPFAISLQKGWNMIGDPFPAGVSLANVKVMGGSQTYTGLNAANAAGLVGYTLYSYPAGSTDYQTTEGSGSLTPYTGYWLYAFTSCTLQVSAP